MTTSRTSGSGTEEQWAGGTGRPGRSARVDGPDVRAGSGGGCFYGPKIDFQVKDAHRREFTNSTVQVDFQLPERFDLEYVAEDGSRQRPVMVHRGAAGSMERLFSYLIERYVGAFPTWLHPVQVVVAPIADAHLEFASEVANRLRASRVRVHLDGRSERLTARSATPS